jgi:hypothetical protein
VLALREFNNKHLAGKRSIGRAIGDYQVSMIDPAFTTGTLLGHSRVNWTCQQTGTNSGINPLIQREV